jgi:FMN phosphatase YigB (HAD superfamily)
VIPPKVRAIIFDIGGVLIRMNVSRATSLADGLSMSPEEVWSTLQKDPHWKDWQEGRLSPRDWHQHLAKRLGNKLSYEQFVEVWNRALEPEPIQDPVFLQKLSKKYRPAVLSNTDPLHVAYMERTYDFFNFFPARIYSCRVGAITAEAAVYIDDIAAYAQAAERLGMRSVVFQSPAQLRSDLQALGISPD